MTTLGAWQGDITTLDVDMIANAANARLVAGGGVDGAIHRAAGPELQRALDDIGGCPTGEARLTPGFGLPARWIAHAVGPVWQGGEAGEADALARCYRAVMALAAAQSVHSLALPAISTGIYGFPLEDATRIAVATVRASLAATPALEKVVFCCFDARTLACYEDALG
ncbi:MAG: O-acetyl-ADP-ribose deacetylase [Pseudomonadales bacterium]|jgi:O-acetyl-ADP-ribose deacetylase (regulator of RNase III)|nr:O-acetyl-ADP-ribose deacetylase [Pseudomonadales bacterium]